MFAYVWAILSSASFWLVTLKYAGLIIAAGSSIWAAMTVTAQTTPDGRKQLTRPGMVAIGLTVLGLIVSIVSDDVQRRVATDAQQAQASREAKRTNEIIIAGQPLTSLSVTWTIDGLSHGLSTRLDAGEKKAEAFIADQQGERGDDQNTSEFRLEQLYPFLTALAREHDNGASNQGKDVVVLIALDDARNAVLPFGQLTADANWNSDDGKKPWTDPRPEGVEMNVDPGFAGNPVALARPYLIRNGTQAVITWNLDPLSLSKSISRQNAYVPVTAKLPPVLRIAIFYDVGKLPFARWNFALPVDDQYWSRGRPDKSEIVPALSSDLRIVPNGSTEIVYTYRLDRVYGTTFVDGYDEDIDGIHCVIFEFHQIDG